MDKTCQKCEHVEVCYFSKMLCEIMETSPDLFENTKIAIPIAWGAIGRNCRHFKERVHADA